MTQRQEPETAKYLESMDWNWLATFIHLSKNLMMTLNIYFSPMNIIWQFINKNPRGNSTTLTFLKSRKPTKISLWATQEYAPELEASDVFLKASQNQNRNKWRISNTHPKCCTGWLISWPVIIIIWSGNNFPNTWMLFQSCQHVSSRTMTITIPGKPLQN